MWWKLWLMSLVQKPAGATVLNATVHLTTPPPSSSLSSAASSEWSGLLLTSYKSARLRSTKAVGNPRPPWSKTSPRNNVNFWLSWETRLPQYIFFYAGSRLVFETGISYLLDICRPHVHRHYLPHWRKSHDRHRFCHRSHHLHLLWIYRYGHRDPNQLQNHLLRKSRTCPCFQSCLQSWLRYGICLGLTWSLR